MRLYTACLIGKFIYFVSRTLGFGGTTWPGHFALKVYPSLVSSLEDHLANGSIVVSGTNGKTTTAHMLAFTLRKLGYAVIHNATSANLANGLATSLLLSTRWSRFSPRFGEKSIGVFEVDEGALPLALKAFNPEILLLLNLSRDQLDRYGDVDLTVNRWRTAIDSLPRAPHIVFLEKDLHLTSLLTNVSPSHKHPFKTPRSSFIKGQPQFFQLNARAVTTALSLLKIPSLAVLPILSSFTPVFGRGEVLEKDGTTVFLFLAKNPQSFNENLTHLTTLKENTQVAYLICLNDRIPDGRDVSWIYDIDSRLLRRVLNSHAVFVSGQRAVDMALRLKYAQLQPLKIVTNSSLKKMLPGVLHDYQRVVILPTYSAMLEVRKLLVGTSLDL